MSREYVVFDVVHPYHPMHHVHITMNSFSKIYTKLDINVSMTVVSLPVTRSLPNQSHSVFLNISCRSVNL